MPKTQATIITDARERLDEATASAWTDIELRRWINQACRDIAIKTECLLKSTTQAVTAEVQEYTLTIAATRIYKVEYTPTGSNQPLYPLVYKDFKNLDQIWWTHQKLTVNTPAYFTFWGHPGALRLILYPKPALGGTLNIHYYALPTELAVTTNADAAVNIDLPEGWDSAVVDYVEYKALRKDRDPRWQEAKQLYDEGVNDLYNISRRWAEEHSEIISEAIPYTPLRPFYFSEDW